VSALADPETGFDVYDTWGSGDHGWITVGGTSLSSPLVSAMFALAGGSGGAAYPARSIYENVSLRPTSAYDVTDGGNGFCAGDTTTSCGNFVFDTFAGGHTSPNALGAGLVDCSFPRNGSDPSSPPAASPECNATTGYDGPTGVGTPNGVRLLTSTSPAVSLSRPATIRLHHPETFTAHATELVSGQHISEVAFTWGDGHTSNGTGLTRTHTYTKRGHYVVVLVVTDSLGQQSVTHTSVTVGEPVKLKLVWSGSKSAKHGHTVKFQAKTTDPNTGGRVTKVSWSWGDGHASTGTRASHIWRSAGTYRVIITVKDNTGVTTKFVSKTRIS
jgi:PKD domain